MKVEFSVNGERFSVLVATIIGLIIFAGLLFAFGESFLDGYVEALTAFV